MGAHPIDDTFCENTNTTDVLINTMNSEEQIAGSNITKFHTPKDKEIVPEDLLSQVNQHFDNRHNRQLMPSKHDTNYDPSIEGKLVTREDELIPSVAMQDQDHINIMNEFAVLVGSDHNTVQGFINDMVGNTNAPTSQSKPSMPDSTLHRISKIVMNEAVRDKMMELIRDSRE